MSLVRRKLRSKRVPEGFERIEEVLNDFETQLRDAVNEEHEGKRRAELTWKVHRLHWEKNRFVYDLMYVKKAMSKELFDFLVSNKVADGALISKWRKPGYELLCSTLAIQRGGTAFGTTALCRVPLKQRAPQQRLQPSVLTGCVSCASGDGRFGGPVWWNTPPAEEEDEDEEGAKRRVAAAAAAAGGSGAAAGGAGPSGASATAEQHRATWAAAVDPEDAARQDAWEREAEPQATEGAAEGGGGGAEEEEGEGEPAAGRKRAHADERGPGAGVKEEEQDEADEDEGPQQKKQAAGEVDEDGGGSDSGGGDGGGGDGDGDDESEEQISDVVRDRLAVLRQQLRGDCV
jgi:bud site selection protein 31